MDLDAVAGLLQHFEHIPLGDTLLGAAQQHHAGLFLDPAGPRGSHDRLVRRDQRDAKLFEVMFDLRALVGQPGDAVNGFTDDPVEPTVRPLRLSK
nr:hypothetical protein [Asanoa iriomotensis]